MIIIRTTIAALLALLLAAAWLLPESALRWGLTGAAVITCAMALRVLWGVK